jgi:hypothetical protein
MSIYKLKNITQQDVLIDGIINPSSGSSFLFPVNETIDLIDSGQYSEGISYHLRLNKSDFIGSECGSLYENISNAIRNNQFILNDGDNDYSKEDSLYIIKYGMPLVLNTKTILDGNNSTDFNSFNFLNPSEWTTPPVNDDFTNADSTFTITPDPGKALYLTKSKTILDLDTQVEAEDEIFFRVWMHVEGLGVIPVKEDSYKNLVELMKGAELVYESPKIGNPATNGTPSLVHVVYEYGKPIILSSKTQMKLEIGLKNHSKPVSGNHLYVRIEAVSVTE